MSSVCSRCRNLHLQEHLVNDNTPFRVGDILELKESVHTVIYTRILNEAATAKRPAGQSSSPVPAIWDEPDYSKLKGRPAVLMQLPGHRADAWPKVCLLATFRASSVRGWLPDILQHFCAAVHLHDMIAEEPDLYHAHTRPEWTPERSGRPNGWLIACSFSSKGHIQGRWQNRQRANPSSNSSFTVGAEDELMELVAVCVEKWLDWQQECAINRDAYKTYRADYEIWRKDPFYRARTMTANISSPPRVSRRRSNGQEDAVVSASPVGKNKNGKTTSANRFAALADLSSINETETESSASTGSPASDTQETMSVELVREANMGETSVSRSANGNEGDGKKKKRTFKGLATITASISRASMRK